MATALIQERGTVSGNQFRMQRLLEDAGQTFLAGTPLMMNVANGSLKAWDGATVAAGIAGISKETGANLATAGVAQQQNIPGSVQNQPLAGNFSRPYFNDGMTGIIVANQDTMFYGQVGPAQTILKTDVSKQYGMTKDTDNHWFVDKTKTGAAAVVEIVGLDDWDTTRGCKFVFLPSATQLLA
jgi:hypothetical protein